MGSFLLGTGVRRAWNEEFGLLRRYGVLLAGECELLLPLWARLEMESNKLRPRTRQGRVSFRYLGWLRGSRLLFVVGCFLLSGAAQPAIRTSVDVAHTAKS